jgi:hypothetical protein
MLSLSQIDGLLLAIEEAEADDNEPVVNSLLLKDTVVLLADVDKRLEKITRILMADFEAKS